MNVYLCEYEGKAFYIEKERVIKISIKSRVVVDAPYFREENPNYSRPSIKEFNKGSPGPPTSWFDLDEISEEGWSPAKDDGIDPSEVKGDDLLIYSLTVPRFSLGNSRWGKHSIHFCCSNTFPSANINIVELAVADIKEID